MVSGALLGGTQPPALEAYEGIDCVSTCIPNFYIEHMSFFHGTFTLCGEGHDMCMCIPDRVTNMGACGLLRPCLIVVQ
jgi:hypothetical protein